MATLPVRRRGHTDQRRIAPTANRMPLVTVAPFARRWAGEQMYRSTRVLASKRSQEVTPRSLMKFDAHEYGVGHWEAASTWAGNVRMQSTHSMAPKRSRVIRRAYNTNVLSLSE